MKRAIVTYAAGAHEELLEISLPLYKDFAHRHGYNMLVGGQELDGWPAAWNKIPLLLEALSNYEEVVWFDADLIVVDPRQDFPPMVEDPLAGRPSVAHSLVRHLERGSEVPNTGVWRLNAQAVPLLRAVLDLVTFKDHGWWEQAAVMTLMGYTVPPQDSEFHHTTCKCVQRTVWQQKCQFMRLKWNSHPNYRSERPAIVHCSYMDLGQRVEVMRALVKDPTFDYPRYDIACPYCKKSEVVRKEDGDE